jgi:hypothetical protein
MSDPVGWAEYYGVILPEEEEVLLDVVYGQDGEQVGTAVSGAGSEDPTKCIVKIRVMTISGVPVEGAKVIVRLPEGPQFAAKALVVTGKKYLETDENGELLVELIRSSEYTTNDGIYTITVQTDAEWEDFPYTVPDQSSADAFLSV